MCNNKPRVYWNPATVKKTVGFFLGGGCKFVNKFVFKEDFFQRFDIYDPKGFMLIAFWRYREKRHLCSTRKQQMLFGKKISFKCKHVNLNERYLIPFLDMFRVLFFYIFEWQTSWNNLNKTTLKSKPNELLNDSKWYLLLIWFIIFWYQNHI